MKTDMLKALRRLRLPALALAAFLASCTSELEHEPAPGGGSSQAGEAEVTLRLQVPGAATAGKTRAITTEAENKVEDLYILAFKVGPDAGTETFDYYTVARKGTENLNTGVSQWTASLRPKDYEQTFVMIANAQGTPDEVNKQIAALVDDGAGSTFVGEDKETVLKKLTDKLTANEQTAGFNAKGENDHHPFTMYGQTAATKIELGKDVTLTVALHRIVARVNVNFTGKAADVANFSAEQVLLYNFNDQARVIPDNLGETTNKGYEQTVTIPDDAELYPKTQDGTETVPTYTVTDNKVKNTIYLFEAAQPKGGTEEEKHVKRPCIIVEGVYEGKSCYYRVDFAKHPAKGDVTYMDIVRNHSYNITVTNVSGRGSDTAHEALKSKTANITASVVEWNDNTVGNIEFEGDRVLGIATKEYELMRAGGIRLQQVRATTNLKWTAKLYDVNADGTANTNSQPDWINFTNKDGVAQGDGKSLTPQQGTDALQDVYFKVEENNARPERKAIIRFTDDTGRLSVDALVVQNQKAIPVFLNVESGGLEATEIEFMETGEEIIANIEFGPEDVTLSWEIVNGENDGIDINSVKMDNADFAIGNMKGEITSNAATNTHHLQVTAGNLQSGKDWETRNAKLQLIAQHNTTGEMATKEIPLFQKKYGLEIDKTEFLCGGQEVRIYVRGNMPWNASWSGKGFDDAVAAGLIPDSKAAGSGSPSETNWSQSSYISVKTKAMPLMSKDPYAMELNFTHRNIAAISLAPKTVKIKGGVIEVDGKLYEVYGPVDRSYKTKKTPYSDNIPEATIMTYKQAEALCKAAPGTIWGICLDSEVEHEYAIVQGTETLLKSPYGYNFEGYIKFILRGAYHFYERIRMTKTQEGDKELNKQELVYLEDFGHDPGHTYFRVAGTKANTGNLLFDITELGNMVKDKYGSWKYYPYNRDVKWEYIEGDIVTAGIPLEVYGNAWSTNFKPKISNSYVYNNTYNLNVRRFGVTGKLDVTPHQTQEYPTYYFKPIE